jgi:inner membrane protein
MLLRPLIPQELMDNLSHSVAGLAAGELIHRSLAPEAHAQANQVRRRLLLLTCWLASNFPDLDLVLTPLLPAPLGYLLHHRGHTHTLLYAMPQALLLATIICLCWPAAHRLLRASAIARRGFALALAAGLVLYLLMDYLNPYGIHPFHPFDSRWFYGDMVFIVEPLFWLAFGVPLALMLAWRWLRWLLLVLLIGVPLYFTIHAFLAWSSFALLAAIACGLIAVHYRPGARESAGLRGAVLVVTVFIAVQAVASKHARQVVTKELHDANPASQVVDVALSSFPSNPVCWSYTAIESQESAGSYRIRRGLVSLLPGAVPVAACPASLADRQAQLKASAVIAHSFEGSGDLQYLRMLKARNCHVQAWLRFARMPLVTDGVAADMRFSSSPRGNFTALPMAEFSELPCAQLVPAWDFPRADLLLP